jgi:hypothetical protein
MSLNIHKVVGYGVADVKVDNKGKITDERVDPEGYLFDDNREEKYHLQNFFNRLGESSEKWMVEMYSMSYYSALLDDCIHVAVSDGKGVIVICPPNKCQNWVRHDDVIDFCEESTCHNKQAHHAPIGHGIPSYRYLMDARSGRRVPTTPANEFLTLIKAYRQSKSDVERYSMESSLAELACELKFATVDEAFDNLVPLVPEIVVEFCQFLKLFKNPSTVLSLRPMLLSYWR